MSHVPNLLLDAVAMSPKERGSSKHFFDRRPSHSQVCLSADASPRAILLVTVGS